MNDSLGDTMKDKGNTMQHSTHTSSILRLLIRKERQLSVSNWQGETRGEASISRAESRVDLPRAERSENQLHVEYNSLDIYERILLLCLY